MQLAAGHRSRKPAVSSTDSALPERLTAKISETAVPAWPDSLILQATPAIDTGSVLSVRWIVVDLSGRVNVLHSC
jgi:hypothetical protein